MKIDPHQNSPVSANPSTTGPKTSSSPPPASPDPSISKPSPASLNYAQTARQDAAQMRSLGSTPNSIAIPDSLIPAGVSHYTSLPGGMVGLVADAWPWQITKTEDRLQLYCPGRDEKTGANQDKQIILEKGPDGRERLKIQFDGEWLPEIPGKLVETPDGVEFIGDNGVRVTLKRTKKGFDIEFEGMEDMPGALSELDDSTIHFRRSG